MFKKSMIALAGALALSVGYAGSAMAFTYSVNREVIEDDPSVAAIGSITGTITTDGTLGSVNADNVVDWELTFLGERFSLPVGPSTLTPLNSGFNTSASFFEGVATETSFSVITEPLQNDEFRDLFFFANTGIPRKLSFGWAIQQGISQDNSPAIEEVIFAGDDISEVGLFTARARIDGASGLVAIGERTTAPSKTVPEPASILAIFVVGAMALVILQKDISKSTSKSV